MVAGQGTPDQAPARMLAYRHPEAFSKIIDALVENSIEHLLGQLKAGADCVQIFDTWAGVLPPREFLRWSIAPTARIVEGVRAKVPDAKIIGFPRGAGALLPAYVGATRVDAVSIDWAAEPSLIRERVQNRVAVQGNLDPLALIAGGAALDRAVDDVLCELRPGPADLQSRPRHPAGNPDRACRADDPARAGFSGLATFFPDSNVKQHIRCHSPGLTGAIPVFQRRQCLTEKPLEYCDAPLEAGHDGGGDVTSAFPRHEMPE